MKAQLRSGEFQVGDVRVACPLFADDAVLLVLLDFYWTSDGPLMYYETAAQRDAVKIEISTFKADNVLLSHKWWIA